VTGVTVTASPPIDAIVTGAPRPMGAPPAERVDWR